MNKQKVLVTGANGFIGSNLVIRLSEVSDIEILHFVRGDTIDMLTTLVESADAVVHLAGENRPNDVADFARNNVDLTSALCDAIQNTGRNIPLIFVSSMQAAHDNPYGQSKLAAEQVIESFVSKADNSAVIYRLVGVFGKFCKPNYNSVVATFCYNLARGLPIQISDPDFVLDLAYIDDVVNELIDALKITRPGLLWGAVSQTYSISLGDLAKQISEFDNCRSSLISERVGIGLTHALYSTYISNLPIEKFVYDLTPHSDERGIFVEMLKTQDSGQFSFFTIAPGITRGSHYHHSKTEKFLLVSGSARMRFRNLVTKEIVDFTLSSKKPRVVDTIPGWVHDITNIGHSDAIVMLWANEVFDQQNPDCIPCEV
jgi:UDP-2-acetamido-2,6-beta-L-arabino-hexul-4-ose reductase